MADSDLGRRSIFKAMLAAPIGLLAEQQNPAPRTAGIRVKAGADRFGDVRRLPGGDLLYVKVATQQHHRPHFHAYHQDQAAVFAVDTIECMGGSLPKAQQRLVEAWAEIHRVELQHDWELLQSGQPPVKIEPLR